MPGINIKLLYTDTSSNKQLLRIGSQPEDVIYNDRMRHFIHQNIDDDTHSLQIIMSNVKLG